jgi:hypothetical protein
MNLHCNDGPSPNNDLPVLAYFCIGLVRLDFMSAVEYFTVAKYLSAEDFML